MKNRDLQFIIKDMAARLDSHQPEKAPARPGMLSEVEAYMAVDGTLARLHKEFLEARRNRLRATEQQGLHSAMAEMARDLEDSAQSAIDTRMIELRANIVKRMMVERMMADVQLQEMDEYRDAVSQDKALRGMAERASTRQDKRQREGTDSFLMLMLLWWMMRQAVWQTQLKLSLVNSFSLAQDRDYAVRAA